MWAEGYWPDMMISEMNGIALFYIASLITSNALIYIFVVDQSESS